MAVRSLLVTPGFRGEITRVRWTGLLTGDTGAPLEMAQFFDRSIQVVGTFGPGGTLIIEGSNDGGATYSTLTDVIGNNLSLTSAVLRRFRQAGPRAYLLRVRLRSLAFFLRLARRARPMLELLASLALCRLLASLALLSLARRLARGIRLRLRLAVMRLLANLHR